MESVVLQPTHSKDLIAVPDLVVESCYVPALSNVYNWSRSQVHSHQLEYKQDFSLS